MEKLKNCRIMGMPVIPYMIVLAIILIAMYTGNLGGDLLSTIVMLIALGSILFEIGDRIPVFIKWVGGGSMLAMMFTSWMVYVHLIPEKYVESVTNFYDTFGFQTLFICFLMAGSLLVIERDILIKSIVRYIPTILIGVAGAAVLGLIVGLALGYMPSELVCYYILPIMGGGNGAGAIPMSQIFHEVTGLDKDIYYAKAIAILTFANILCVFVAALLNGVGRQFPKLTGDGATLMRNSQKETITDKKMQLPSPTPRDLATCFAWVGGVYALACIMSKVMPKVMGASIHQYAWFILVLVICNIFNLIPVEIRSACKAVVGGINRYWQGLTMAAIGISMTDFGEFISVINVDTLIISLAVVIGAVLATAVGGWAFGFYPVDSAVTAGLCMANRGGGGDIVVLGAANRMDLMSYAAISSRIGGSIVLVIASVVFGILY